jgi:hypothetical protein
LWKKANQFTMAMPDNKTDLKNQDNIIKPSVDQLHEEIPKMLEERAKARAAADLEHALACFEVDRRRAIKKIQDINFDSLPAKSRSTTFYTASECQISSSLVSRTTKKTTAHWRPAPRQ